MVRKPEFVIVDFELGIFSAVVEFGSQIEMFHTGW